MAIGVILEPGVVVSLLAGGTLVNRNRNYNKTTSIPARRDSWDAASPPDSDYDHDYDDFEAKSAASEGPDSSLSRPKPWDVPSHNSSTSTLVYEGLVAESTNSRWRQRTIRFMGWEYQVTSPNTEIHKDRFLSRLLRQFPFLVEVWYWALIYWVWLPSPLARSRTRSRTDYTKQVYQLGTLACAEASMARATLTLGLCDR